MELARTFAEDFSERERAGETRIVETMAETYGITDAQWIYQHLWLMYHSWPNIRRRCWGSSTQSCGESST
jgi:hypothetical protein